MFGDFAVEARDLDRVRETAGGEMEGVPEAVVLLDGVFADDVVRRVVVVPGGDGMMAGFEPGVVLSAHDVAVHAGLGIIRKICLACGVEESVSAEAEDESEEQRDRIG